MNKIFPLFACILIGCATFREVPTDVHEVSLCNIINDSSNWLDKEIFIEGKVKGFLGNNRFILQCLHNPKSEIKVDTISPGVRPVETSDRIIKVYGKLTLSDGQLFLKAIAVEVGEKIEPKKSGHEELYNMPSGGHHH